MNAIFLPTVTEPTEIVPANGSDFTLQELYNAIGCEMIEIVYLPNDIILIVDEEGMLKPNPVINRLASHFAHQRIVGNAILCPKAMVK
jgi:hypothetical protein